MVVEIRRYLGNTLSAHIHDADHEHPNCHLGRISREPALVRLLEEGRKPGQTWATTALLVHGRIRRPRVRWGGTSMTLEL